ncbi:MAG: hypothetical protein LBU87_04550 [Lactobacillales bacterium]|jgi:hypothetical protein|nr:hypothetical protein [Lactobacillales bacterium]
MKFKSLILAGVGVLCLNAAAVADPIKSSDSSVLICRSGQCAMAQYSMTREFLYNKLADLFEKNQNKNLLLCDADPISRVCYDEALGMNAESRMVAGNIRIPSIKLIDTKLSKEDMRLNLITDYRVAINQTTPRCQVTNSTLRVDFVDKVEMKSEEFGCQFTSTGNVTLTTAYNIDYIDFDFGILGAKYVIASGGVFRGGKTGYALMRFTEKLPAIPADEGRPPMPVKPMVGPMPPMMVQPAVMMPMPMPMAGCLIEQAESPTTRITTVKTERFKNGEKVSEETRTLSPEEINQVSFGTYNDYVTHAPVPPMAMPCGQTMHPMTTTPVGTAAPVTKPEKTFWEKLESIMYLGD